VLDRRSASVELGLVAGDEVTVAALDERLTVRSATAR